MSLKKNILLMGFATAVRLVAGLLTFSVLARLLGPEAFGELMLWLSVAMLISLLENFGLTTYVLRAVGANPARYESLMNEGLTAKLLLATVITTAVVIGSIVIDLKQLDVLLILLIGCIADTFTEFINAGFRARDNYATETRISSIFSFIHTAMVCGAVIWHPTVIVAAMTYSVSRLLVLTVTAMSLSRLGAPLRVVPFCDAIQILKDASNFAADFGMQSLFGQVDSVVLNHYLGPIAVGIYQAGMRLFLGGFQAGSILANVFLPRASAHIHSMTLFHQTTRQLQIAFLSAGIAFGFGIAAFAVPIVSLIYGSNYADLAPLMPFFGLLFFLRFAAAGWGVVLTAAGQQSFRSNMGLIHWIAIAALAWVLVPSLASSGWLISLCFGTLLLGCAYAIRARKLVAHFESTLIFTAVGCSCFIPFLRIQ